ncbi:MAG: peroxiredoxin [Candidatus Sericytochromatia bacterium]|nr:peroxiredoxin [Candidatus Tanganyikabacteria bacterium]
MLDVGDSLPETRLEGIGASGEDLSTDLRSLARASGGLILYVYPKDDTPGCTTQACDFRDALAAGFGVKVVGISPDSVASHRKFMNKHGLSFPLLSDTGLEVLSQLGAHGEKKMYGKLVKGVIRSTFVADGDGVITCVYRAVKAAGHAARMVAQHG